MKTWTDEEMQKLRNLYPDTKTSDIALTLGRPISHIYAKAAALGLKKSESYLASPAACRLRRGDNVGTGTRFKSGHASWNKGMKGLSIAGKETQFKPGHRPLNAVPVGTTVMAKDGYLKIKVAEPNVWRWLHRKNWEDVHGPIAKGMCLVFKNGNTEDCDIGNMELVTRSELMKRNTVHNLPKELAVVVQLRGALNRKINARTKKNEQQP